MTTTTPRESINALSSPSRDTRAGSRWARAGAAGGVAFVVLNVAGAFLPGAPPATDASAAKIATYFTDHAGAIKAQLLVGALGIVALLFWFGALWRMLSREEDRSGLAIVAAVSLAIGLALALISGAITATAAIRVDDVDTTRLLWSFSLVVIAGAGLAIAAFLVATCIVVTPAGIAPRWSSYVGWVAALVFLAAGGGIVSDSNVFGVLGLAAFLVWCVWILAVSAFMWRADRPE